MPSTIAGFGPIVINPNARKFADWLAKELIDHGYLEIPIYKQVTVLHEMVNTLVPKHLNRHLHDQILLLLCIHPDLIPMIDELRNR